MMIDATTYKRLSFSLLAVLTIACSGGEKGMEDTGERGEETLPETLDFESDWLSIPYDDPMDARTVLAVYGMRQARSVDDSTIELSFGPSFNAYFASSEGFGIYSPDDSNYAYDLFVEPTSISMEASPDAFAPIGEEADLHDKTTVTLDVPTPLVSGARYFVRAIGGARNDADFDASTMHQMPWTGYPVTAGINARQFVHGESADSLVTDEVIVNVVGLRSVQRVAPDMLRVVVGGAANRDLMTDPSNYTISSAEPNEDHVQIPVNVGLRAYPEVFLPGGPYPFPDKFFRHEIYLQYDQTLSEGSSYVVTLNENLTSGRRNLEFNNSNTTLFNPHLKVNQEGYRPDAVKKRAFYGAWMGTLGPLDVEVSAACHVHDSNTDAVVFSGQLEFRHDAVTADEGNYGLNESQENLYVCDFSTLSEPGDYYVSVDGAGRSYEFSIADDVFEKAFHVAMRGLFINRSNSSFEGTNSAYIKTAGHGEPVSIPYKDDVSVIGGHYDAGDYNPRVRWEVARDLMAIYEFFPSKFKDGHIDIPEKANGIPDILDEVAWSLLPFFDLQDADGGIGGSNGMPVESHADPNFVETIERDPWLQHSYNKETKTTLIFTALAAKASRLWVGLGETAAAERYLSAALRSWEWAVANPSSDASVEQVWAASQLAHATGDDAYVPDLSALGFNFNGDDDDDGSLHAAMAYAMLPEGMGDETIKSNYRAAVETMASNWAAKGDTFSYPILRHPWAPTTWGGGAYPTQIDPALMAYGLDPTPEKQQRLHRVANLTLGVNPLNFSWITGLGDNPIVGSAHLYGWSTYQGLMPPGLQSEGPNQGDFDTWFPDNIPDVSETPTMYSYYDIRYCIGLNEGVVTNMAKTAMMFAALLPNGDN